MNSIKLTHILNAALASLSVATSCAHGAPLDIACPASFPATAVQFSAHALPAGWSPFMPSSLAVQSGGIMFGPPESMTYSKPDGGSKTATLETIVWRLRDVPDSAKWLSCMYGASGEVTLSMPITKDVDACTIRIPKDRRGNILEVTLRCERSASAIPTGKR